MNQYLMELARKCGAEEFYNEPHKLAVNARVLAAFAAALSCAPTGVPDGYEKMRGGKPVQFWRDDALEAAAGIVEAYHADKQIAVDIRAMKSDAANSAASKENDG